MVMFDKAFNSLKEAIMIHDGELVTWCNDKTAELFGYDSSEDIIGRKILRFVSSEYRHRAQNSIKRIQDEGESGGYYKVITRDGSFKSIKTSGGMYSHDDQDYYVGIIREIKDADTEERALHLLSTIKHETMTPLSNALGNLRFILETRGEELDEEIRSLFDVILNNLKRLECSYDTIISLENVKGKD